MKTVLFFFVSTVLSAAVPKDDWIVGGRIIDGGKENPATVVHSGVEIHNNYGIDSIAPKSINKTKLPSMTGSSMSTVPWVTSFLPIPSATAPGSICVNGAIAEGMSGNFLGLCSYSCSYNHCPPGVCKCTQTARAAIPAPSLTGWKGCPLFTEDSGPDYKYYANLCEFTCSRGYCPRHACAYCL